MNQVIARRCRAVLASLLSAAILLVSPGAGCHEALAIALRSAKVPTAPVAARGWSAAPRTDVGFGLAARVPGNLSASLIPNLGVQVPADLAADPRALSLSGLGASVSPLLEQVASGQGGLENSSLAGRRLETLLLGSNDIAGKGGIELPAAFAKAGSGSFHLAQREGTGTSARSVPETTANSGGVDGRFSYGLRRRLLAAIALLWGASYSLPAAGPALARRVIAEAAGKKFIFSDFDDTLGAHNSVLAPDMVEALVAARKRGKEVVVITDRPDEKRAGSATLTVFESLASIPAADRAGMYVAANVGGRVYQYDALGEPRKVYDAPAIPEETVALVKQAAEATKLRMAALGAVQYPDGGKFPPESHFPYGYSLMLAVGTPEATVKAVAGILQEELASRGIDAAGKVLPQMAKDPNNPPYVNFKTIDKSIPVAWLAKTLGIRAEEAVALGDSLYAPKPLRRGGLFARWAGKLAERLSGRPLPLTGNETDRNMEKGLPGMLALSVGGTADPRMKNAFVLPGKGPAASKQVLLAAGRAPVARQGATLGLMAEPRFLPNPATLYPRVYEEALAAAKKKGYGPEQVYFGRATASTSFWGGGAWKFAFYLLDSQGAVTADEVFVETDGFLATAGQFHTKVSVWSRVQIPGNVRPDRLTIADFTRETKAEFADVMTAARLSGGVSVSLHAADGTPGLWYRFYGDLGGETVVNAATGEYLEKHSVAPPPPAKRDYTWLKKAGVFLLKAAGWAALLAVVGAVMIYLSQILGEIINFVLFGAFGYGGLKAAGLGGAAPTMTDLEVRQWAWKLRPVKGGPRLSADDWDAVVSSAAKGLKKKGATAAQLDIFRKICDDLPVVDAGFKPPKTSQIRDAAAALAKKKGGRFSAEDWANDVHFTAEGLKRRGATPEQLALFAKKCAALPIVKGRFAKTRVSDAEIEKEVAGMAPGKGGRHVSNVDWNMSVSFAAKRLKERGATEKQVFYFWKLCGELPLVDGGFNPWSGD